MLSFLQPSNKLSNGQQLELTDIVCRMLSTDGEVSLQERIWMKETIDSMPSAKKLVTPMLCPDYIPHKYEVND